MTQPVTQTPGPESGAAISAEWAVWVQGMDEVLPTLGRADALARAHKANEAALWIENDQPPGNEMYRPLVWAIPCRYGAESPAGERCTYPLDWTAEQVDNVWAEWP